jgi:hypothetical protein
MPASNFHSCLVDFNNVVRFGMAGEHNARSTKCVGDEAVRTGLDIAALNGEHPLRLREVPSFAAVALL